jgi:hypothetical protein
MGPSQAQVKPTRPPLEARKTQLGLTCAGLGPLGASLALDWVQVKRESSPNGAESSARQASRPPLKAGKAQLDWICAWFGPLGLDLRLTWTQVAQVKPPWSHAKRKPSLRGLHSSPARPNLAWLGPMGLDMRLTWAQVKRQSSHRAEPSASQAHAASTRAPQDLTWLDLRWTWPYSDSA